MKHHKTTSHTGTIVPDMTRYADRGYLNILDTNNTYFDYDMELDELWLDLEFPKSRRSRRIAKSAGRRVHRCMSSSI